MEARKFAVRVRKLYWRCGLPDSAERLKIGLERRAPGARLSADDWTESNDLREDLLMFLNIREP